MDKDHIANAKKCTHLSKKGAFTFGKDLEGIKQAISKAAVQMIAIGTAAFVIL